MSLLPIPWASYQCNSAKRIRPLLSRTRAIPLSFRHRPAPYIFLSLARSRIEVLTAIVSMSRISPMISKSTVKDYTGNWTGRISDRPHNSLPLSRERRENQTAFYAESLRAARRLQRFDERPYRIQGKSRDARNTVIISTLPSRNR